MFFFRNKYYIQCLIENSNNGVINISFDKDKDLSPLDRFQLFYTCLIKILFDLGNFEGIVIELIDNINKSILNSNNSDKYYDIQLIELLSFIEQYHKLDFNISKHLKIDNFSIIEGKLGEKPIAYSKYQIYRNKKDNIFWETNSYHSLNLNKVFIPINIAALYNFIFKKYVFGDKIAQNLFQGLNENFIEFTKAPGFFNKLSDIPSTQGWLSGQIFGFREAIMRHKEMNSNDF